MVRDCALFNKYGRTQLDGHTIEGDALDIEYALEIIEPILDTNRLGMPPETNRF